MATQAQDRATSSERPTHVRYWVIVFAVTLAVITYIDRLPRLRSRAISG
jgi:hypothetical protein